jgi:hypothetical protein
LFFSSVSDIFSLSAHVWVILEKKEFLMKKFAKVVGIIAVAAVIGLFASCGDMGGTLEVKNGMSVPVAVTILGKAVAQRFEPGQSKKYTYDIDTTVTVSALGVDGSITDGVEAVNFKKKVTVEKGKTVTVTVIKQ